MHDSSGIANAFKVEAKHDIKLGGVKRDDVAMVDCIACGFVEFLINNSKCWPS
jgi:Zn ribbon nucleic-acid-binding protein